MPFFLNYGYKFTGISNFVQFPKNVPGADVEADEKKKRGLFPISALI